MYFSATIFTTSQIPRTGKTIYAFCNYPDSGGSIEALCFFFLKITAILVSKMVQILHFSSIASKTQDLKLLWWLQLSVIFPWSSLMLRSSCNLLESIFLCHLYTFSASESLCSLIVLEKSGDLKKSNCHFSSILHFSDSSSAALLFSSNDCSARH